jgi:hypothetical protein
MAALAAAGNYFIYGRHAGENREKVTGWTLQLKGEMLQELEKLEEINQRAYYALVDKTARRYGRVKRISAYELKHITVELKNAWTHIGMTLK